MEIATKTCDLLQMASNMALVGVLHDNMQFNSSLWKWKQHSQISGISFFNANVSIVHLVEDDFVRGF